MEKTFESTLPEGYREAYHIDAENIKIGIAMNAAALILMLGGTALSFLILRPRFSSFSPQKLSLTLVILILYLVGHELVHGAAYKLLTGQRLTFGLTLTVAFCGVPDIYVYRRTALIALLAPFTVFSVVFLGTAFLIPGDFNKLLCAFLFWAHFGGCAGDLYDTILYLFRFRSPDTLMRDTGPAQTFYVKEELQ